MDFTTLNQEIADFLLVFLSVLQDMVQYNLAHSFMSFNTCYTDTGLW